MTTEATFSALVDRVIAGQPVESREYAEELRVASLVHAARPVPAPAFASALERRLAVGKASGRLVSPRFAWAGGIAAMLLVAVLTVTPARAGVAGVIANMIHVFVSDAPEPRNAEDEGGNERPARPAEFSVVEEVAPGARIPTELPEGFGVFQVATAGLRSGATVQIQYALPGSDPTITFTISVLRSGFDFASQGSTISGHGVVGTLDRLNDRVGTNVLSWTDGRYLYQIFAPMSPDELLEIAGSAK